MTGRKEPAKMDAGRIELDTPLRLDLIKRRELRAFRVGSRLLRVPPDAVEEFEAKALHPGK